MDDGVNNETSQVESTQNTSEEISSPEPILENPARPELSPTPSMDVVPQPVAVKPPTAKKRNLFLLILVIVTFLIFSGSIGYVFLKNSADKAAASYTKSLKEYIGEVYEIVSTDAELPIIAKDSIDKLDEPQLEPVLFGQNISTDYTTAENLENTTNDNLDDLNAQVDSSIAVYNFMVANNKMSKDIASLTGDKSSLEYTTGFLNAIKQIKTAVDANKDQAPEELKVNFTNLSQICDDMASSYTAWVDANNVKNDVDAQAALKNYSVAAALYDTNSKPIIAYYVDLSEKLINSANDTVSVINNAMAVDAPVTQEKEAVVETKIVAASTVIARTQISTVDDRTCYVGANSVAYCWGSNGSGELGNNTKTDSPIPVTIDMTGALKDKTIESLVVGGLHVCALASDSQAYCWGYDDSSGRLGAASNEGSLVPIAVSTRGAMSGKTVKSIAAGEDHTCVIASDDKAYCWGANYYGQLGIGSTTSSFVPVAVDITGALKDKTIKSIVAGGSSTCVITSDSDVYCWGYNNNGQLGNFSNTNSLVPAKVATTDALEGKTIKSISISESNACAIADDNNAYCWGGNQYGQLGNGTTRGSSVPVAVDTTGVLSGKMIKSIAVGLSSSCAVASDDQVYCWGNNKFGGLGTNSITDSSVPVAVDTTGVLKDKSITSIATSTVTSCAVTTDNKVYCWGYNTSGQLGNNLTTNSLIPVAVELP